MLSRRQFHIVTYLNERATFIQIHHLATHFNVSERTIQYDLEYIEDMAHTLNLEIERNKHDGIKITSATDQFQQYEPKKFTNTVHYSKKERILYITLKLFETKTPTSSQTLATMVSVTRRTIVEDLKTVQQWLSQHDLMLEYKKNKGFVIEGSEHAYRKGYADMVHEYFQIHTHQIGHHMFSTYELEQIRLCVTTALKNANYQFVQSAIDGLIYHIMIAIHRVNESFVFEIPKKEYEKLQSTEQFEIALQIKKTLETIFQLHFPKSEAAFITLHLLGAKTSEITQQDEEMDDLEILVAQLIERMSGTLGLDLMSDTKLHTGLIVHLRPALHRLKFDMTHDNPLKLEIIKQYSQLITALEHHLWGIEENYQIHFNEDELTYIVLHFASAIERISTKNAPKIKVVLLCGSGIGTSQLLKSRIRHIYPELDIVDAYSIYEIDEKVLKHEGVDYIISTVPFQQTTVPVINVTPFLNQEDRKQLNKIVNLSREKYVNEVRGTGPTLAQVLPESRLLTQQVAHNRDDAIKRSVSLLVNEGVVDEAYTTAIIQQLEAFGPYMVISPHIALIHANHDYVKQSVGFSLIHFKDGIHFSHETYDPVKVIITLATKQPQIHLNALRQLSELIMDSEARDKMLSGDKNGMMMEIKNISQ
ncbi:BglG family transcription antiterminator [Staphylococcus caeli]|uniref:Transcriptional antiterminator, BglG family / PTS system, mannitol/fructose-specific IIA component n=1 Tax=Staphylococcus caeli TaxID=2201815 RepID=A0A1D4I0H0_9STAP|nr:BglG family transcription antiterminator [Staphylococcus caeli]SCS42871.1 Putative transcriptional antiterminator, BglG family / PTS system, mannitol/fructose-specific IIA component [Staphylococcus caeli]SCS61463.1 Putative transcriptional antiterminator, BglG family / PTS system, mannitol/fructose-specific IIA component [Staphylococcus caeli]